MTALTPEQAKRLYDVGAEPLATIKELTFALKALRACLNATGQSEWSSDCCVGCGNLTEPNPAAVWKIQEHADDCPVVAADALLARLS